MKHALIFIGFLFIFGAWPASLAESPNLTNLYGAGGFDPGGVAPIFAGIATAILAFVGAEVVSIAAAESYEPERGVARAVNQVVYRVLLFYVLSIFLVAAIVPWNTPFAESDSTNPGIVLSPFAVALNNMGIAVAPTLMNIVLLTAVLSVLNSGLYISSRMLFALTRHGDAPQGLTEATSRAVPARAILLGTVWLPRHAHGVILPGYGVPVPAELLGRRSALRLPHRCFGAQDAGSPGA